MMKLEEILMSPRTGWSGPSPEIDPLREVDALQEAQLLDVRVYAVSSTVGLLFELRTALHFAGANTALLVARGVSEFSWAGELRPMKRTAWNVIGSTPRSSDIGFSLNLECIPNASVQLVAQNAEFYAGNAMGLTTDLPDYGEDDDATIRSMLVNWESGFSPTYSSIFGPE